MITAAIVRDHMAAFQLDNDLSHLERAVAFLEDMLPALAPHARWDAEKRTGASLFS